MYIEATLSYRTIIFLPDVVSMNLWKSYWMNPKRDNLLISTNLYIIQMNIIPDLSTTIGSLIAQPPHMLVINVMPLKHFNP